MWRSVPVSVRVAHLLSLEGSLAIDSFEGGVDRAA